MTLNMRGAKGVNSLTGTRMRCLPNGLARPSLRKTGGKRLGAAILCSPPNTPPHAAVVDASRNGTIFRGAEN